MAQIPGIGRGDFLALHMGKPAPLRNTATSAPLPIRRIAGPAIYPAPVAKPKPLSKAQRRRIERAAKVKRD